MSIQSRGGTLGLTMDTQNKEGGTALRLANMEKDQLKAECEELRTHHASDKRTNEILKRLCNDVEIKNST